MLSRLDVEPRLYRVGLMTFALVPFSGAMKIWPAEKLLGVLSSV